MQVCYNPISLKNNIIPFGKKEQNKNNIEIRKKQVEANNKIPECMPYYLPFSSTRQRMVNSTCSPNPISGITKDRFTNLKDKSCLLREVNEKKLNAEKEGKNLQIAMFDMDNFKSINEILGYEIGDVFIKKIANIINKNAESNQMDAYRFGGEEFILMTTGTQTDDLCVICDKVRDEIVNDSVLSSYKVDYVSKLNTKLATLEEDDQILRIIEKKRTEMDLLNELLSTDISLLGNKTLRAKYKSVDSTLNVYTKILLQRALKNEENSETKNWLQRSDITLALPDINAHKEIYANDELYKYLDENFNKRSVMYQLKKWLSDFNKNGFSITCGVADIEKQAFLNKPSIDLVNTAGEILKSGKNTQKGRVYMEHIE